MRNYSKLIVSAVIAAVLMTAILNPSTARAATRVWHEAQLSEGYGHMALPIGRLWPVVATDKGTHFLGPTGFTKTSSATGRVIAGLNGALAVSDSYSVSVLNGPQWMSLPPAGGVFIAPAFHPGGQVHCASIPVVGPAPLYYKAFTGTSWVSAQVGNYPGGTLDLEIDGAGVASILAGKSFISQGTPGGYWDTTVLPTGQDYLLDLAVSADGVPGIVGTTTTSVVYWTYDAMRLEWVRDTVASFSNNPSVPAALCFDNNGHPAIAYEAAGEMHFAINDGSGAGWTDSLIDSFEAERVSLAFDSNNNPVACFSNGTTTLVEYDPIVVPEPTVAMLLVIASGQILRRRREELAHNGK